MIDDFIGLIVVRTIASLKCSLVPGVTQLHRKRLKRG